MGLLSKLFGMGGKKSEAQLVKECVDHILGSLTDERGVRAEDAIAVAAVVVGERCIDAQGEYDLRDHDLTPGSRVFSDGINQLLCGDQSGTAWSDLPEESVFGMLRASLDPSSYPTEVFPALDDLFGGFAAGIGDETDWGTVPLSVPKENQPSFLPLQVGYDSRAFFDEKLQELGGQKTAFLKVVTIALAKILEMVAATLEPKMGIRLALELINGMAKTAPMTDRAMKQAIESQQGAPDQDQ